VNMYYYFHYLQ